MPLESEETKAMDETIWENCSLALRTSSAPAFTSAWLFWMSAFTSLDALAVDWARERTSVATTANPLPLSPARAASTPALSASRFVWNATSSMTPMISEILPDETVICAMALSAPVMTWLPFSAMWLVSEITLVASPARLEF